MLALKEAHAHLDMLQKVVSLIQDQDLMKKVVSADSKEGAYELLKDHLA
jgi:galactitol PTS system EIIA component